jgi:hypothetical protein
VYANEENARRAGNSGGLAMSYKLALVGAVFAGAVISGSSGASATIITLELPDLLSQRGQDISSEFNNGFSPTFLKLQPGPVSGLSWIQLGLPQYSADGTTHVASELPASSMI